MTHEHRCSTCRESYTCHSSVWFNHDGEPECVCPAYHDRGETECQECVAADRCAWCGDRLEADATVFQGDRMHLTCLGDAAARERQTAQALLRERQDRRRA